MVKAPGGDPVIFFPGDHVRFRCCGRDVAGVIEGFGYDVPAILRGDLVLTDTASVRIPDGVRVVVPVVLLEAAAS